ncbi:hypothetical protein P3S67_002312 [Capsicum chacoense]
MKQYLDINLPSVENIPDWCSVKVTAPSICFTMPTVHNNEGYKFLGMVVWFVIPLEKDPLLPPGYFFVTVSDKQRERDTHTIKQHEEVSCVYYISCSTKPYAVIKGGEKITVHEHNYHFKHSSIILILRFQKNSIVLVLCFYKNFQI